MSDTHVNLVYIKTLSVWFDIYLSDSQLILMSCFWRQICRNAFVEPIETLMFANISLRSLVPVQGLLFSVFQLEVLPQQRTSWVSTALLVFRIQLESLFIVWWSCFSSLPNQDIFPIKDWVIWLEKQLFWIDDLSILFLAISLYSLLPAPYFLEFYQCRKPFDLHVIWPQRALNF